jgi:predicted Rossmann fold nucleotide-binding protein DprA/Smf involved in DNA uptake
MPYKPSLDAPYWLALLGASPLSRQVAKRVIQHWCLQENQPLANLFQLPESELAHGLNLTERDAALLKAVETLVPDQARLLDELARLDVQMLTRVDVAYPEALVERLPEERLPYLLFYRGNPALLTQPGVCILGADDPAPQARAVASRLAETLATDRHHLVGGYAQGVDRLALDVARSNMGRVTMVLPVGIRVFARVLAALEGDIQGGRLLVLSPYAPDAPLSDAAAAARLTLAAALADAVVLVAPSVTPSELLVGGEMREPGRGVWVWSGHEDPITAMWREAGASPFAEADEARAGVTALFGARPAELDKEGGSIDDLYGVEPIAFEDADDAIEVLGRSGRVPDVLARRLRERDWTDD